MRRKYEWFFGRKDRHRNTVCTFIDKKFNPPLPVEWAREMELHPDDVKFYLNEPIVSVNCENVERPDIGTIVDTLTRFVLTKDGERSFEFYRAGISSVQNKIYKWKRGAKPFDKKKMRGYANVESVERQYENDFKYWLELRSEIKGGILTTRIIELACYLVQYNNVFRAGIKAYKKPQVANEKTVENIREMVRRSCIFLERFGSELECGVFFNRKSFCKTKNIGKGDGDYCTKTSLIDMKVKNSVDLWSKDIYQMIIYYLLKQHEGINYEKIYIFNPRWGWYYECDTKNIRRDIIRTIKLYW